MKALIRLAFFIGSMMVVIEGRGKFSGFNSMVSNRPHAAKYLMTRQSVNIHFIGTNNVVHYFDANGVQHPKHFNDGKQLQASAGSLASVGEGHWLIGMGKHMWRWNAGARKWHPVPNTPQTFNHVSAFSFDKALAAQTDNSIVIYENGKWTKLEGQAKKVAIGKDDDMWVIGMDNSPYRWEDKSWVRKPLEGVAAVYMDMLDKDNIVVTDDQQRVYMWDNGRDRWVLVDESKGCTFTSIDQASSGNCGNLYCIDKGHHVWRGTFDCTHEPPARDSEQLKPGECATCKSNDKTICAESCDGSPAPDIASTLKAGQCRKFCDATFCAGECRG